MALSKDNPKNKLVDGKVLEHVLILLKGYIEASNSGSNNNNPNPIEVYNTDSEQVKELVYDIIYGLEETKPGDEELIINKDIPLVSYLIQLIKQRVDEINIPEKLEYTTEKDIVRMFENKNQDT